MVTYKIKKKPDNNEYVYFPTLYTIFSQYFTYQQHFLQQ